MRAAAILLIVTACSVSQLGAQQASRPIDPPQGARLVLQAKGAGVQIYSCTNTPEGLKWVLKAPDAKLLGPSGEEIGTHFAGPTWKLTDGSQVQGELVAKQPSPDEHSVPWLLLRAKAGTASGEFANVAFIRRTETHGGAAPDDGCENAAQVDKTIPIPYTAIYSFYGK